MLKVFRKIRRNLMETGKTSRYLKYAMGEIVLVVIGILIALQINNWNQQRLDLYKETNLLKALKTDFSETKNRLEETMALQQKVVQYSQTTLTYYETDLLLKHRDSIAIYLPYGALSWWRAEPVTGTYDAMISTGNIELLRNENLKRYLAAFDAEIKSGFEDHEYSMDLLNNLTLEQSNYPINLSSNVLREQIGLSKITDTEILDQNLIRDLERLKENKRFFGLMSSKLAMDMNRLERQEKMHKLSIDILQIINNELKETP